MKDKQNITLNIAREKFSLTIDADEEEIYRRAQDELNNLWEKLRMAHKSETDMRTMARVAFSFARAFMAMKYMAEDLDSMLTELDDDLRRLVGEE